MAGLNAWDFIVIFLIVISGSLITSQLARVDLIEKIRTLKIRGPRPGPRGTSQPYHFEIITLRKGSNKHEILRKDTLEFSHGNLKVQPEKIYLVASNPIYWIINKIQGIKARFLVIFLEGQTEALTYKTPKISPSLLKIVEESRALSRALKDEFKEAVNVRQLFFFLIILIVGVVIYMAMTGGLPI